MPFRHGGVGQRVHMNIPEGLNYVKIELYCSLMFVATHVTMGALVGQNAATPELAFCLGVASHFLLDIIPHGDSQLYYDYKAGIGGAKSIAYPAIDSAIAVILFIYLLQTAPYASRSVMVAGVIGSIFPDFLVALGEGVRIHPLRWFQRLHIRIHDAIVSRVGNISLRAGIFMQLILLFTMIYIVKR